jgi:hypothetical protein
MRRRFVEKDTVERNISNVASEADTSHPLHRIDQPLQKKKRTNTNHHVAEQIWMAVIGPDTKPVGEVKVKFNSTKTRSHVRWHNSWTLRMGRALFLAV